MIRRRYSKRDGNHVQIVRALRDAGRQVVELHAVGGGVPDLLVIWPGGMILMEIKNPHGKNRAEDSQVAFWAAYRGPARSLVAVRTEQEALAATGVTVS